MHELDVGPSHQLIGAVAQAVGPGCVHAGEVALEVRHGAHLVGDRKPAIRLSLDAVTVLDLPAHHQRDGGKGQASCEVAVKADADLYDLRPQGGQCQGEPRAPHSAACSEVHRQQRDRGDVERVDGAQRVVVHEPPRKNRGEHCRRDPKPAGGTISGREAQGWLLAHTTYTPIGTTVRSFSRWPPRTRSALGGRTRAGGSRSERRASAGVRRPDGHRPEVRRLPARRRPESNSPWGVRQGVVALARASQASEVT